MAKMITHIDGVEVVAAEVATGPSIRNPDKIAIYKHATKVLLADSRELYVCSRAGVNCSATFDTLRKIVAHMQVHGVRKSRANGEMVSNNKTPESVIKQLVSLVEKHKANGVTNFCERAAVDLNKLGLRTVRGHKWQAISVSIIYNNHVKRNKSQRVTVTKSPAEIPTQREVTKTSETVVTNANVMSLMNRVEQLAKQSDSCRTELQRIVEELDNLWVDLGNLDVSVDPEIVEKARLYDEMRQKFFG